VRITLNRTLQISAKTAHSLLSSRLSRFNFFQPRIVLHGRQPGTLLISRIRTDSIKMTSFLSVGDHMAVVVQRGTNTSYKEVQEIIQLKVFFKVKIILVN